MSAATPAEPLGLLLLEDSPADARLLVESLRDRVQDGSLMIQTVRRLADALRELKRFRFSCVLVDLGLPDGQGVANVSRIREADPDIAIVVLTGLNDQQAAQEAFRLGAQDYLVKGERWGLELLSFVEKAVGKRYDRVQAATVTALRSTRPPLRYQPWTDLGRRRFGGVRCLSPDGWRPGCIAPAIVSLAADLQSWRDTGFEPGVVSVSLESDGWSAAVDELGTAVAEHCLRPESMVVRIDIAALAPAGPAAEEMQRLAAAGFAVWVEGWRPDFALLDRIALRNCDGLAIDMAALAHLGSEPSLRFLRATLAASGSLGMVVALENLGSEAQQEQARVLGVRWVSGDRYCGPESGSVLPLRWRRGPSGLDRTLARDA